MENSTRRRSLSRAGSRTSVLTLLHQTLRAGGEMAEENQPKLALPSFLPPHMNKDGAVISTSLFFSAIGSPLAVFGCPCFSRDGDRRFGNNNRGTPFLSQPSEGTRCTAVPLDPDEPESSEPRGSCGCFCRRCAGVPSMRAWH
ncbi:unnamed protein product [Boreogadus saida]